MTPTPTDPSANAAAVAVTQADRDAAADIWRDYVGRIGEIMVERGLRSGTLDNGLPSILARHRLATPAPSPAPGLADELGGLAENATPGPWMVRKGERGGEVMDCFITAPDVHGFAYDAEILGDDEYQECDGLARKIADCEMIVTLQNNPPAILTALRQPDAVDAKTVYGPKFAHLEPAVDALLASDRAPKPDAVDAMREAAALVVEEQVDVIGALPGSLIHSALTGASAAIRALKLSEVGG